MRDDPPNPETAHANPKVTPRPLAPGRGSKNVTKKGEAGGEQLGGRGGYRKKEVQIHAGAQGGGGSRKVG